LYIDYAFSEEVIMTNKELALALEKEYEETGDNAGTVMPPVSSMDAAVAIVKKRKTKVGTSFDPGVLEAFKAKAERVGIPYQTLLNSVVKRYTESKLDIEVA
jgi:predicted DNA binding CopG/RHH family protein